MIEMSDISGTGESSGFGGLQSAISGAQATGKPCEKGIRQIIIIGHGDAKGIVWPNKKVDDKGKDTEWDMTVTDKPTFPDKNPANAGKRQRPLTCGNWRSPCEAA